MDAVLIEMAFDAAADITAKNLSWIANWMNQANMKDAGTQRDDHKFDATTQVECNLQYDKMTQTTDENHHTSTQKEFNLAVEKTTQAIGKTMQEKIVQTLISKTTDASSHTTTDLQAKTKVQKKKIKTIKTNSKIPLKVNFSKHPQKHYQVLEEEQTDDLECLSLTIQDKKKSPALIVNDQVTEKLSPILNEEKYIEGIFVKNVDEQLRYDCTELSEGKEIKKKETLSKKKFKRFINLFGCLKK